MGRPYLLRDTAKKAAERWAGRYRRQLTVRARVRPGRVSASASTSSGRWRAARGRLDAVIAGLLFMAGMRRSEVAALCWR